MNQVYSKPNSELLESGIDVYVYETLGIWRKIFLWLNWIVAVLFSVAMFVGGFESNEYGVAGFVGAAVFAAVMLGYTYWLHYAISKRDLNQLLIIGIVNIIPFLNPIASLLVFLARSKSKSERGV